MPASARHGKQQHRNDEEQNGVRVSAAAHLVKCFERCLQGGEFGVGVGKFLALGVNHGLGSVGNESFVRQFLFYRCFEAVKVGDFFFDALALGLNVDVGALRNVEFEGAYEERRCGGVFLGVGCYAFEAAELNEQRFDSRFDSAELRADETLCQRNGRVAHAVEGAGVGTVYGVQLSGCQIFHIPRRRRVRVFANSDAID